jgi:hypothetical protein
MRSAVALAKEAKPLRFPHKQIRARVIADFVRAAGYRGVVVFTCGNAAQTLRDEQLEVTEIGPRGDLKTEKWWTLAEIHRAWPDLFDATSGHLTAPLMWDIAKAYGAHLGNLPVGRYSVPSGSGETIVCLRLVYPLLKFEPAYDDSKMETTRHSDAPLNAFVDEPEETEEEKQQTARLMAAYAQHVNSTPLAAKRPAPQGSLAKGLLLLAAVAAISVAITVLVMR